MTDLIACLGTGKGTWTGVLKLVSKSEFERIFLVVNSWTKDSLKLKRDNLFFITIDSDQKATTIRDDIIKQLDGKIKDFEVAVNIDSGTGKEHAALITALIKLGLALRFVVCEADEIEELSTNMSFSE
jgi:hypothetical protein